MTIRDIGNSLTSQDWDDAMFFAVASTNRFLEEYPMTKRNPYNRRNQQGVCGVVNARRGMISQNPSISPYVLGGILGLLAVWILRLFL